MYRTTVYPNALRTFGRLFSKSEIANYDLYIYMLTGIIVEYKFRIYSKLRKWLQVRKLERQINVGVDVSSINNKLMDRIMFVLCGLRKKFNNGERQQYILTTIRNLKDPETITSKTVRYNKTFLDTINRPDRHLLLIIRSAGRNWRMCFCVWKHFKTFETSKICANMNKRENICKTCVHETCPCICLNKISLKLY